MSKAILLLILLSAVLGACEKSIDLVPADVAPSLTVEAYIENGRPPVAVLSRSLNYFNKITPELLAASFIHDAEIVVSNGVQSHRLREYKEPGPQGYDLFYYTTDSANLQTAFAGEFNGTYQLSIRYDGQTYTASTSIPPLAKKIDSLWWEPVTAVKDSPYVKLMAQITDPPAYGNYIRYFTKVNSRPFLPGLASVFDDQIINGKTYTVQVDQGVDRNLDLEVGKYNFFKRGDTITVKFCNIDKATFDFWRTVEYSYASIGNPFSSPTKVTNNISGGALGYFGGYAVQYISLMVPR